MMYDDVFARSFTKHDQRRMGYVAFLGCILIALSFSTVLKPYLGPLPVLNLKLSMGSSLKMMMVRDTSSSASPTPDLPSHLSEKNTSSSASPTPGQSHFSEKNTSSSSSPAPDPLPHLSGKNTSSFQETVKAEENTTEKSEPATGKTEPVTQKTESATEKTESLTQKTEPAVEEIQPPCNVMERGDICEIDGDVRIQGSSSSVFFVSSQMKILAGSNNSWNIRPYARKSDQAAMSRVREWTVKSVPPGLEEIPQCGKKRSVPAILFSQGGYGGNQFHDFSDIIIPLYLTSRQYNGEVQFLVTDKRSWWISKFQAILKKLSRYELIDIDKEEEVYCFPRVIVGLKRNIKELTIDPSKYSYSLGDFREFLRSTYSLKRATAIKLRDGLRQQPRLLILSRKRTRSFTNVEEIAKMAGRLGFEVSVAEATMDVSRFAEMVNSCDVMLGVHGAGLTNILFLPEDAIFIQVVPFGKFEWMARTFYGNPAEDMNLKYLEYRISKDESTLIQQYPPDHEVFTNPSTSQDAGWETFKSVYMDKQNVKLDVNRFRPTLLKALELLH